jgi:hypothetical protein
MIRAITRGNDHCANVFVGEVELGRRIGYLKRARPIGTHDFTVQADGVDVSVDRIEKLMHPALGIGDLVAEIGPKRRHPSHDVLEPAQQAYAVRL